MTSPLTHRSTRLFYGSSIVAALAVGVLAFLAASRAVRAPFPLPLGRAVVGTGVVFLLAMIAPSLGRLRGTSTLFGSVLPLAGLVAAMGFMVATAVYALIPCLAIPVDLLSYAESPFVNDILKLRAHVPIFTPPQDNNAYPYNPGTQVLTYALAALLGRPTSIPVYRTIQFSYVLFAVVVAVSLTHSLARQLLSEQQYRHRWLWWAVWSGLLFLVCVDPRFNAYNHSLHNDGLALLLSLLAFWLMANYARRPRAWLLIAMAVLPAAAFAVKQNQLLWFGIFSVFLAGCRLVTWRRYLLFALGSLGLVAAVIGIGYLVLGREDYLYWAFVSLGSKQVSLLRSVLHLFQASLYALMGLFAGWLLVLPGKSRMATVLWCCWLVVFGLEAYTSGIDFQSNHLGPGVVLATSWFFVALLKVWPSGGTVPARGRRLAQETMAVAMVIFMFGALGFVHEPRHPVPKDFSRYVDQIEQEFAGFETSRVLMDIGTWMYLKGNVVMKDRSAPISVHTGPNQPQVNRALLAETIRRLEQRSYDKILARQLDTGDSWYDFHDQGTGVKEAILRNYHEVRRIAAVSGIRQWWPDHLVAEIIVYVPNRE